MSARKVSADTHGRRCRFRRPRQSSSPSPFFTLLAAPASGNSRARIFIMHLALRCCHYLGLSELPRAIEAFPRNDCIFVPTSERVRECVYPGRGDRTVVRSVGEKLRVRALTHSCTRASPEGDHGVSKGEAPPRRTRRVWRCLRLINVNLIRRRCIHQQPLVQESHAPLSPSARTARRVFGCRQRLSWFPLARVPKNNIAGISPSLSLSLSSASCRFVE